MKAYKIYQVDVFTKEYYKGNPAAVCILDEEIDDVSMRKIAAEMNLSETAFLLLPEMKSSLYSLRWFTPEVEVSLCGHGTIAAAKVLYDALDINMDEILFTTLSGKLKAKKYDEGIGIDLPLDVAEDIHMPEGLMAALGIDSYEDVKIGKNTRKLIIKVDKEDTILKLNPDFNLLKNLKFKDDIKGVAVTTNNTNDYDFVSRYFNPWAGINEDPVTGSVHTVLAAYWGGLLKKTEMKAYQASYRGGVLNIAVKEDNRLEITGDAVIVMKGEIYR